MATLAEAKEYLCQNRPSVILLGPSKDGDLENFCNFLLLHLPDAVWILNCEGLPPSQIIHWINFGKLHDVVQGFEDPDLVNKVQSALEAGGELAQRRKLMELFEGQSQQFKRLTQELEKRVQKRYKTLSKSLHTLENTKERLHIFHKALLGIYRAASVGQIEQTLNEALISITSMVRVRFENQSSIKQQSGDNILAIELPFQIDRLRGEVLYFGHDKRKFSPAETDFLFQITEALALALARLNKLEQAEVLKAQWQATFDSIPHPLCLTTPDHEILKLNHAFLQECQTRGVGDPIGKNCFKIFFGPDFKATVARGSRFTFRYSRPGNRETEHFEVFGEPLGINADSPDVRLVLIRSITEEVRFERRILETAKLAELGTIGSSIAHELNNPLGGMLSFLQLILMDLKRESPLYRDIKDMELAVLRCRDIVQNLLSFARKQDLGDFHKVRLCEVINRAVKLIELQSKSMGIAIEQTQADDSMDPWIYGSANALTQALCNLLQNSIDAIAEKLRQQPLFPGRIRIRIDSNSTVLHLRISDNGTGIAPDIQNQIFNPLFTTRDPHLFSGMGLTIAFTIISEHHGNLEILSQTGSGTTAIISLPTLDQSPD